MMKCPNCGMTIFEESNYCAYCDFKIDHPDGIHQEEKKDIELSERYFYLVYWYKIVSFILFILSTGIIIKYFLTEMEESPDGIIFMPIFALISIFCIYSIFKNKTKIKGTLGKVIGIIIFGFILGGIIINLYFFIFGIGFNVFKAFSLLGYLFIFISLVLFIISCLLDNERYSNKNK